MKDGLRILMVLADATFPPDIRIEKEARALIKAGHEVFLACMNKGDAPLEEIVGGIRVLRVKHPVPFTERAWNFGWLQLALISPHWVKALSDIVRARNIQVLHVHDLPMVKTGLSAARRFKLPLVADLHENHPEAIKVRGGTNWKTRLLNPVWRWKGIERYCVRKADRVIAVVDEGQEHYVNDCGIPPEKVTVVMNTEDLDYFLSLPVRQDIVHKYSSFFTISYIGAFGPHRGIHTAISAMPDVLKEIPNARLLLVGTGETEGEFRQLAESQGVAGQVEFTGRQPFSLVPSFIAASRICLVPHIASGHTETTIPHKLFQYMALGKPVIVSSARPLARIVNETGAGLVYPSGDSSALARAIIRLNREPGLAAGMGDAGKKAVQGKYGWKTDAAKLVRLYEDIRAEKQRRE